jgi:hypothetical protein
MLLNAASIHPGALRHLLEFGKVGLVINVIGLVELRREMDD